MTPALPDASEQLPVEPEAQESELLLGEHPVEPTLETQDRQAPAPVETGLIASPSTVPADISQEEPAFGYLTPIAGEEPQQPAVQEEEPVTEITEPAVEQAEVIAGFESQPPVVTMPVAPATELAWVIAGFESQAPVGPTEVQLVGSPVAPATSEPEVIAGFESQPPVGTTDVQPVTHPVEPAVELTRPITGDKPDEKSPALRAVPTVAPDDAQTTCLPAVGEPDAVLTDIITGDKPPLGAESQTVGSPVEPAPATVAPAVLSAVGTPAALLNFPLENQPLVGIIDTGFAANNPDIDYSQIILGRDYVGSDANPLLQPGEGNEHGTYVLGVIAAKQNNGTGIDGINDKAPVWLGRAVGSGNWADSLVEFVSAAQGSAQPNAVVNLSFDLTATHPDGSVTTRYELTGKERAALNNAQVHQVLIVAAAGNQAGLMSALGQASKEFDNIITVGAADGMNRAAYSGAGEGLDILAFGGTPERPAISTAGEGVGAAAGTSIAAAAVTGAASLVWAANPELSYRQVKEILLQTAADLNEPGWDALTGFGLLNLQAAVETARGTVPEPLLREPVMEPVMEPLLSFDLTATGEAVEGAKPSERPAFDRGDDYRIVSDSNSDNISYTSVIPSASLLFDGPSLSYTSEVPSFSPTSDIPIVISRSDDSESAGLINEPPRFISTNDIPIVISGSYDSESAGVINEPPRFISTNDIPTVIFSSPDSESAGVINEPPRFISTNDIPTVIFSSPDSESAGVINEPPRFISTNDIPIVISSSPDSESAGHTAVEHSDYIPSVSQTAISYSSVIPSVSQTAVSYSYEVPSISYSYEVPSVSYSYEVPSVSYSYEVPSISYSYEVPSVSYSYEVPSISYSYEVPSVSYSYEVPSISYSYEVPSVSQTITSNVSTSFAGSTPSATYTSVSYSDNTPSVSQTITSNVSTSFAGGTPSATYTSVSYSDNTPSVSQTITSNVSTSFAGGTPSATYTSVSYSDNTSSVSSTYETSSAGDWSNTWEGDWSSESGDDGSQDSGYIDGNSYDTGYGDSSNYGWGYGGDYDYGSGYGGDYDYGSGYGGDYDYGSGYGGDYGYGSGYNGDHNYGWGYGGDYGYGSGYGGDYGYGSGYGGDYNYGSGYGGDYNYGSGYGGDYNYGSGYGGDYGYGGSDEDWLAGGSGDPALTFKQKIEQWLKEGAIANYDRIISLIINKSSKAERRTVTEDSTTMQLIRDSFSSRPELTNVVMACLLQEEQKWQNPPANDFTQHFANGKQGYLPYTASMNCWEMILYAAFMSGLINAEQIYKFMEKSGYNNLIFSGMPMMGYRPDLPVYRRLDGSLNKGERPKPGQLLFFKNSEQGNPGHVALSLGGNMAVSLWDRPYGINSIQIINIAILEGIVQVGAPMPEVINGKKWKF